mmetsp:Transcript_14843/g.47731  ORF Transcript_14843/g.47731 Transcript_14843/m.47731 type:complete len:212 (+) Transcript_14843:304-939(+)
MHHAEATRLPTRPIHTPVSTPLHAQTITGFSPRPGQAAVRVRGGQGAPLARRAVRPPPRRRRLCHGDARVQPRALTRPRQHPQPLRVVRLLLQALRHRLVLAGPVGRLPRCSRAAPHPERARLPSSLRDGARPAGAPGARRDGDPDGRGQGGGAVARVRAPHVVAASVVGDCRKAAQAVQRPLRCVARLPVRPGAEERRRVNGGGGMGPVG